MPICKCNKKLLPLGVYGFMFGGGCDETNHYKIKRQATLWDHYIIDSHTYSSALRTNLMQEDIIACIQSASNNSSY